MTVDLDGKAAIRFIICLGVVSMFADMTYEGAHSVIGPLLSDLGSSATQVGFIAGVGEMFAASLRLFSGRLADKTRAYWTIAIFGYAINNVVVPALAFAGSWKAAALLIIAERTGKALRGPARDVLLSGATHKVGHGFGFGVHAAFDQAGAVMGPLFVAYAVAKTNHFGPAFLWLAVPAVGAFTAMLIARAINRRSGPCTLRRGPACGAAAGRGSGQGTPSAPAGTRLRLLPSGPDLVRGPTSQGTLPINAPAGGACRATRPSGGNSAPLERIASSGHR